MNRNTAKILLAALLLVLSVFSVNTFIFSLRLFQFSLSSTPEGEKEMDLLAKNLLMNKRLKPLVSSKLMLPNEFLASFMTELIKSNKVHLLEHKYPSLFNTVLEKFPENIFLAHYGLYEEGDLSKDWENFDLLALKVMRDPGLNSLVYPLLTTKIAEGVIPQNSLPHLIFYLDCTENFSLAENLLSWAVGQNRIEAAAAAELQDDLDKRRQGRPREKYNPVEHSPDITFVVAFDNRGVEVKAGRNLLAGKIKARPSSLKKQWILWDISDTEQYAKGSFYGQIDSLENNRLRVMGFFIKFAREMGYANGGLRFEKRIFISEGTYLFHFRYKTSGRSESPSFWLSWDIRKANSLEPTDSDWREVFYIFNNSHYGMDFVRPFLRMFGTGSVWFDDIGLYKVDWEGTTVEQDALIIQ